jgi:hypothetical protein
MAAVCDDHPLIETMVCDARTRFARASTTKSINQAALRGLAHRPSPSYLAMVLNRVGVHDVCAADPPDHADCRFSWLDNLDTSRSGALLRAVFVASRSPREHTARESLLEDVESAETTASDVVSWPRRRCRFCSLPNWCWP